MSLNVDWSVVGYQADPVPGNPDGVDTCAKMLKRKKDSVDSLVDVLNKIMPDKGGSVFVGDAAEQYARKLSHFPEDMKNLSQGLEGAHRTLNSWKSSMEEYQKKAHKAYDDARKAGKEHKEAQQNLDGASATARNAHSAEHLMRNRQQAGEDVSNADEKKTLDRVQQADQSVINFRNQVNSTGNSYWNAMKRLYSAIDGYNEDARNTASSLRGYLEKMPSPSLWERVYYSSAWSVVVKVAEIGGTIFGIAALVLGFGGIIGMLLYAFIVIGFLNDWMAHSEGDESDSEFRLSIAFLILSRIGLCGEAKGLFSGLKLFKSEGKGMSVLSKLKLFSKLRLLGDPTKKGGYLVSHFSKMLGKPNGILPVSKWAEEAKSLAATSSKRVSIPLLWLKGFGRGVWSSAKTAARKAYDSMLYTYIRFGYDGFKFVSYDAGKAAAKVKGFVAKNGGVKGAVAAVRENPLYETVTSGIRSVAKDEVDAMKRQVHNQDKGSAGWRTSVSEGLGYLKPFSPMGGSLGSVLALV
ncbi:putative T7SS-secreted protein [Bifidobacterium sp. ESL0819]|uniref:putative T7SS-secreted protein n=1 Tax=Bifidobacterium sp. ESL0819 TaxID=3448589 RepID=UPI00404387D9